MRLIRVVSVFVLCLCLPALAQATTYTYSFSGSLSSASGAGGLGLGGYTGTFSYNDNAVAGAGGNSSGSYVLYDTPARLSITSGGVTYNTNLTMKYDPGNTLLTLIHSTSGSPFRSSVTDFSATGSASASALGMTLYSEGQRLALQFSQSLSGPYQFGSFSYTYTLSEQSGGGLVQNANVNLAGVIGNFSLATSSSTPTPLPAAVWLLGAGLGGLGVLRRRRASAE